MSWLDTDAGRYVVLPTVGPDGRLHVTYAPADQAKLDQSLSRARGMIEQLRLPDGTQMKVPGVVPRLNDTPGGTRWPGPELGEHTHETLAGLGYDDGRIAVLKSGGII